MVRDQRQDPTERRMQDLDAILSSLLRSPASVAELSPELVQVLQAKLLGLQVALTSRLLAAPARPSKSEIVADDRLLTPLEASQVLKTSVRWLYRHANHLPFTRRLSRKALRFSEAGIRRYLAARGA